MTEEKKKAVEKDSPAQRIIAIAAKEGVRFPDSLVDELAGRLAKLKVTPAEFTNVIREVAKRFGKASVD
ncbi:MAG TPA: hypothetical protein VMH90_03230, partial [Thermoplasmata archaeon]|nr:hypothetical protein [Thermoplasmata archaeon]